MILRRACGWLQERVDGEQAGEWADEWEGKWQNNCNMLHFDNNHAVYISNLNNIVK